MSLAARATEPADRRPEAPEVRVGVRHFAFAGTTLFQDFQCRLEAGCVTCLLGPSGVGKSSLLRLVAGLLPGALLTTSDRRPLTGRIALMAQNDLLLPWLDVTDNLLLGYRLRGAWRQEKAVLRNRAATMLERVGLAGRGGDRPASLSGGMRQRVALARTLLEDRPVVLMDEPFSALDVITRHRLQDLAGELLAGRTVLLVTHSPLEALRLGHRVWVLGGAPASLRGPILPAGPPPREVTDRGLLAQEAELLRELVASTGEEAVA